MNKYGTEYGPKIFEITNRMFDTLPICAVVDDAIFCAHGGIPKAALTLEEIGTVPVEMDNPFQQSTIAWEILWSDPMPQSNVSILLPRLSDCLNFDKS